MSGTELEKTEEARSELKRALLVGDLRRAEDILRHHPEAFTQTEQARLAQLIERARFGTTTPVQDPELMATAARL